MYIFDTLRQVVAKASISLQGLFIWGCQSPCDDAESKRLRPRAKHSKGGDWCPILVYSNSFYFSALNQSTNVNRFDRVAYKARAVMQSFSADKQGNFQSSSASREHHTCQTCIFIHILYINSGLMKAITASKNTVHFVKVLQILLSLQGPQWWNCLVLVQDNTFLSNLKQGGALSNLLLFCEWNIYHSSFLKGKFTIKQATALENSWCRGSEKLFCPN